MQYFGFQDPTDNVDASQPDASKFNNDAANIDVKGVFANNANFFTDPNGLYQFPGQLITTDAENYAVVLEGYFYGPQGEYTVSLNTATDDYGYVWTNTKAYSAWTNANADIIEHADNGTGTQNFTFTLTAGEFLPITIVWINVYKFGGVEFEIYPPAGGAVTDTTGYFVQPYSTDGFVYHVST